MSSRKSTTYKRRIGGSKRAHDKIIQRLDGSIECAAGANAYTTYSRQINVNFTCASTIKGLRWDLCFAPAPEATGVYFVRYGYIIQKAQQSIHVTVPTNTLNGEMSATATPSQSPFPFLYRPDEECIIHDNLLLVANNGAVKASGSTKGMRKVMPGDNLIFFVSIAGDRAAQPPILFMNDTQYVVLC